MRHFKICSHKRSGTHLLMATLWVHLDFGDGNLLEPRPPKNEPLEFLCDGVPMRDIPYHKLFGSHEMRENVNIPDNQIIYIYRKDSEAVYRSCCKMFNGMPSWSQFEIDHLKHIRSYQGRSQMFVSFDDLLIPERSMSIVREVSDIYDVPFRIPKPSGWFPKGKVQWT